MERAKNVDGLTRQQLFPQNGRTQVQANSAANFSRPPPTLPFFERQLKHQKQGLGLFDGPRAIRPKQQSHLPVDPPAVKSYVPNVQSNSPFPGASQSVTQNTQIESSRINYDRSAFEGHAPAVESNIHSPRNNSPFFRPARSIPQNSQIHTNESNYNQRVLEKVGIEPSNKMHPMMHMGSAAPAKPRAAPAAKKISSLSTPPSQVRNHAVAKKKKSGHVSEMTSRFSYNKPLATGALMKKFSPPKSTERYNKPLPRVPTKSVTSKNTEASALVDSDETTLIDTSLVSKKADVDGPKSILADGNVSSFEAGTRHLYVRKAGDADRVIMGTPTKEVAAIAEIRKNTLTSPTKYMPPGSKPAKKAVGTIAIKKSPVVPSSRSLPPVAEKPKDDDDEAVVTPLVDSATAATLGVVPSPPKIAVSSPNATSSSPVIDRLTRPTVLSAAREADAKAKIQSRKSSGTMSTIKNAAHRMKNMMHSSRASRMSADRNVKGVVEESGNWALSTAGSTIILRMPHTVELASNLRDHLNLGPAEKLEHRFLSLQDKLGFITHLVGLSSNKWLKRRFMLREASYKDHLITTKLNQIRLGAMALQYEEAASGFLAEAMKWDAQLEEAIVKADEEFSLHA